MKNIDVGRARWMKVRIGLLTVMLGTGFTGLATAAWNLQVRKAPELRQRAEQQYLRQVQMEPRRGTIYDRHHNPLAVSVPSWSLSANPRRLALPQGRRRRAADLADLSLRLSAILDLPRAEVESRLRSTRGFQWIKRHMSEEEHAAVQALVTDLGRDLGARRVEGLDLVEESRRWYPQREWAAHITGFVSTVGDPLEGLERSMNEHLHGRPVAVQGLRDARGRLVFADGLRPGDGQAGDDVVLTIDATIQMIAARELALTCQSVAARGGSIIVTDPSTGEVLAMANYPTYNPNEYGSSEIDARRNRALTDRFEPGSTMKIFTVGAALDAGVIHPGQTINCYGGTYHIGDLTIHDSHPDTMLTPMEVLARSSNIGAAQIGLALGSDGLERAFRRFGFGERTGLPLPGEARARFGERRWYDVEVATVSFGQGVGVTAMQLAQGLGAVANGGRLLRPILVSRVLDATGALVEENVPDAGRAALQPATARLLSDMLTAVTEPGGTGTEAAIPGVRVAGKTGTAQKARERGRGYDNQRWVSSFIGFAPANRPRLVVTVVIDEPQDAHAGGAIAAPLFRRVMEQSLRYLGALPATSTAAVVPPTPAPRRRPTPPAEPASRAGAGGRMVPSVVGLGAREAVERLHAAGAEPALDGSGTVVRQEPEPGAALTEGTSVRLWLEPAGGYTPAPSVAPVAAEVRP
ncbi:MAG: penicillin-binding transpeptidase domain-containing protein [Polyangiales bacterium]